MGSSKRARRERRKRSDKQQGKDAARVVKTHDKATTGSSDPKGAKAVRNKQRASLTKSTSFGYDYGEEFEAEPEELTPELFEALEEKYGDKPDWLRIAAYKEAYDPVSHRTKSEIMLKLTGKDYWFPLSPAVYDKFLEKILHENRGKGLRYLQNYIRTYKTYKERWPSKRYVRANKLPVGRSLMDETLGGKDRQRERKLNLNFADYAERLGLSEDAVEAIYSLHMEGVKSSQIALSLGVTVPHIESALTLIRGFEPGDINDSLIKAVADGVVSVEEAVSRVSTTMASTNSKKALRALRRGDPTHTTMKSMRVRGMAPRSPSINITPQSFSR
jgi:hypothetical protein